MEFKVKMTRTRLIGLFLHMIFICERLVNCVAIYFRAQAGRTDGPFTGPNSPEGWEKSYIKEDAPLAVLSVTSEIAQEIIELTRVDESLLETGCGSGILSAEIAVTGRKVAVCDFSQLILERVKCLFRLSNLAEPGSYLVDITKRMPFDDNQFDVVWSSGVLEHWTDEEILPIVQESARCAKRCVISFVPNEMSLLYRYGRESAEAHGIAPWGRELPRSSLKDIFERAGLVDVMEKTCCLAEAPGLINATDPLFAMKLRKWWNSIPDNDPVKRNQGYLLLTVGHKNKV
jgi:SAM-dependent methyltransferase